LATPELDDWAGRLGWQIRANPKARNFAIIKLIICNRIAMSKLSLEQIKTQLDSPKSSDRMVALAMLRDIPPESAVPLILKVLDDESLQVRSMAVFALGVKQTDECYPILAQILENDPDYGIRADAAGALGYLGDSRAVEPLLRAFYEDTDWLVRFSAAVSLGNLKDPRARHALLQALESEEVVLHQAAIAAFGGTARPGSRRGHPALL
jgi:FOG: HEAT repeat